MSKLGAGIYAFFLVLFGLLCYLAHRFPYFPGDIAISLWLQAIKLPFFKLSMQGVSFISSFIPSVIIVILVAGGLLAWRRKLEPIFIAALAVIQAPLNSLLKLLISRPRPSSEIGQVLSANSGFSFPSGHTTYAVVFYGFLFYLTPRLVRQPVAARTLQSLLILLIFLTAISRIYLGAHWASDTLGSLLFGGLLLVPAIALYNKYSKSR